MPRPRFSLRTLLIVLTVACIAIPFLISELMKWSWWSLAALGLFAVLLLPTVMGIWFVSVMDKWADKERQSEQNQRKDEQN